MFKYILVVLFLALTSFSYVSASNKNLLIVVTGASKLKLGDGDVYNTGYWLEEFSTPYQIFEKAGLQITIATPNGTRPSVDPGSAGVGEDGKPLYWPSIEDLNNALVIKKRVLDEGSILSLSKFTENDFKNFDAVFFPGGHGPMEDMIANPDVARVLKHFHKNKKTTALVCHAPAVLVSTLKNGFLYKGYRVTGFTDAEESQTPVGPKMITTPEKALKKAGAKFEAGPAWQPHVIEDRELITGQNPASSKSIADALLLKLK